MRCSDGPLFSYHKLDYYIIDVHSCRANAVAFGMTSVNTSCFQLDASYTIPFSVNKWVLSQSIACMV